jgi:tetratricopeptide (TPR) repeat protein
MQVIQAIWLGCVLIGLPSSALAIGWFGKDLNGLPCTGDGQGFGPFDYTNTQQVRTKLGIVEAHHFTPEVEQLIRGKSGSIASDLDYTLRAFPNHHRALFSLIRYVTESREWGRYEKKPATPPECYLQRAMRFRPEDGNVYLLYGLYLHRLDRQAEAEEQYRRAVELMPRSAEAHYNLGILLVDMERYAEAKPVAAKAYELGYPLSGLRRMLSDAGHPLDP